MITIKEEFLTHAKTKRAIAIGGSDAVLLWLALKAFAAAHPTDGFVPYEALDDILLGVLPSKKRMRAIGALRDCGHVDRDGARGPGLVHELEFGLQLHDYTDHALDSVELEERRRYERDRKGLQRDRIRLKARLEELGLRDEALSVHRLTREEVSHRLEAVSPRDMSQGVPGHVPGHVPLKSVGTIPGTRAPAPTRMDTRDPNPTQPNPTQPNVAAAETATHEVWSMSNPESARQVPIRERCRLILERPFEAQWCSPHEWPELQALHDGARQAMGLPRLALGPWRSDASVRALATLFATFELEQLDEAIRRAAGDPFVRGLVDVAQWTPRVVRQLLGPPRPSKGGRQPDEGDFEFVVEEAAAS